MARHRFTYAVALACSVFFFALYPFWFAWYLLVALLLLIPFDILISIPGVATKRLVMSAPNVIEKDSEGALSILTSQKRAFPSGSIRATLEACADNVAKKQRIVCDPERGSLLELAIDSSHSGVVAYEIKRIKLSSLVGLFSISIPVDCNAKVLVMPAPVRPPHVDMLPRGFTFLSKAGGGFSEDHELRQYREGDPLRSIHWKLSAKHDSLIVREPLVPPPHLILIQVSKWDDLDERDLILGRLRWVSDYLLGLKMPFCVKQGDEGVITEITDSESLVRYLLDILDMPEPQDESLALSSSVSPHSRFSWVFSVNAKEETMI